MASRLTLATTCAQWIVAHVTPFLIIALARPQNVIEKFSLPYVARNPQLARHTFTRPLLPELHELWQRLRVQFRRTKKMHVIRHYDISADRPAMALVRGLPLFHED